MALTMIIPSDTEVRKAARLAHAQHLHLITDGSRTALSPVIPAGWTRIAVNVKETHHVGTTAAHP